MSFHFKQVRIKDWLVYGGDNSFDLPDYEEGRNIVVFNGQNGFGKTSLLKALAFVFEPRPSKSEIRTFWNEQASEHRQGSVEVGLEFSHSGRACKIVRGGNFKPWGDDIAVTPWVKLFVDGTEVRDQVEDKIAEILPRDCLEFIFFDGAEISRYAQKQHKEGVHEAIEKVLGIPSVRNLRDDLKKIVSELESEQEQLLSQSSEADDLLLEVEQLKEDEEKYVARHQEIMEKRQSLDATKTELEKEAEGIDAIERERDDLKDKMRRRADLEERRSEYDKQVNDAVAHVPLAMLLEPLRQIVEELRVRDQPSPRREGHSARLTVLRDLIERDESCLCDREIDDSARTALIVELERVEKLLNNVPKKELGAPQDLLDVATLLKSIEARESDAEAIFDRRANTNDQLEELETDIRRLEQELQGHADASVNELFLQIGQINQQIEEQTASLRSVDEVLERTRSTLQQKQRDLDEIGAGNEQAKGVTRTLEESRRILAAVTELVQDLVESKREGIQSSATDIFIRITNKPDEYASIRVNTDYSLAVIRKDGTAVENAKLSAGEKEVLAYSFITALNLSSVDPAPFVMDTPFGHLDSGHRHGLLRSLPKLEVQAILLATDRDLPADERDQIDGSIAKEFTLVRDQRRALTTIEEC